MSDVLYYISLSAIMLGIPALLILTIIFLAKPHIISRRRNSPISRKRILSIGLASVAVSFVGFGTVMAATTPSSIRAANAASAAHALAEQKTQIIQAQLHQARIKQAAIDAAKPVTKTTTNTEVIPYTSVDQNDSSLAKGQRKISTAGSNGTRTISYVVTYVNGAETARTQTSSEITTQPINQVILIGTYVAPVYVTPKVYTATAQASTSLSSSGSASANCPNGSYVNTAGNTVCNPYKSSSAPSGATAKCNDGSYSFSQSHKGTCSGHGGVSSWL